jgi:hypothetical protein
VNQEGGGERKEEKKRKEEWGRGHVCECVWLREDNAIFSQPTECWHVAEEIFLFLKLPTFIKYIRIPNVLILSFNI